MTVVPLNLKPGIYSNQSDGVAVGRYIDGNNVRFVDGEAAKVDGWSKSVYAVDGVPRGFVSWSTLENKPLVGFGTEKRLYVFDEIAIANITPINSSGSLTDPFETTSGSDQVKVNHTSHGLVSGQRIRFSGATAVGGITINGEYDVGSPLDSTSYTITAASSATSTATGGGTVSFESEIAPGNADQTRAAFSVNPITGGPPLFTGGITEPRIWELFNWGEDMISHIRSGKTYLFQPPIPGNAAAPATIITQIPECVGLAMSQQARHLIAFGAHDGTNIDEMLIRWCSSEDYTDWTPTSTNTAGDFRLDSGNRIITAIETRGGFLIFTDKSVYTMTYIGGDFVFSVREAGDTVPIAGPNAAVDINGTVFFMGKDDFMYFDGVSRVHPCDIRSDVFDDFNRDQATKTFVARNKLFEEIMYFYCSTGSTEIDRVAVYNYQYKIWWKGDFGRTAWIDDNELLGPSVIAAHQDSLYFHGSQYSDNDGQPLQFYIETFGIEAGTSEAKVRTNKQVFDWKNIVGNVDISVLYKDELKDSKAVAGPVSTNGTKKHTNIRARGRQISVKISGNELGNDFRLSRILVNLRGHGEQ